MAALHYGAYRVWWLRITAALYYSGGYYVDAVLCWRCAYGGAVLWRLRTMAAAYYGGVTMTALHYRAALRRRRCAYGGAVLRRLRTVVCCACSLSRIARAPRPKIGFVLQIRDRSGWRHSLSVPLGPALFLMPISGAAVALSLNSAANSNRLLNFFSSATGRQFLRQNRH
jgi:hypothetical protein